MRSISSCTDRGATDQERNPKVALAIDPSECFHSTLTRSSSSRMTAFRACIDMRLGYQIQGVT